MMTPSTPPPQTPPELPYHPVQESPYEKFNDSIAENAASPEECRKKDSEFKDIDDIKKAVYESAEAWAADKKSRDARKRDDDIALGSRKNDEAAAVGPPEPPDAPKNDISNSDLANSLADAEGISLAPEVASDYRVNTLPRADNTVDTLPCAEIAQDLSEQPSTDNPSQADDLETLRY